MKRWIRTFTALIIAASGIILLYTAISSGNGASPDVFIYFAVGLLLALIGISILLTKPRPDYDLVSDYWSSSPRNEAQMMLDRKEQGVLVPMTVPTHNEFAKVLSGDATAARSLE